MSERSSSGLEFTARDELAQLKALAEEGRERPLLGGRDFVLFGAALALASGLHAAIVARWLPWPPIALAGVWFAVMGGAALASRLSRSGPVSTTVGNRVEREVWRAGGFVLAVLALGILAHALLRDSVDGYRLFALMPPITFGIYAIALAASAAAARADYLKPYAALSIAFLAITVLLASSIWQFAAMALGAVIVSVLPGLAQLRRVRDNG